MCDRFGLMDTTNSLTHLVSCWNLMRIRLWTPQTLLHILFHAKILQDLTYRHHGLMDTTGLWTPQTLSHISFHAEISRELLMDTTGLWTPRTLSHILFHAEISWELAYGHHKLSHTSHFMLKSHENWLMDTTNSLTHLISCWNLVRFH